MFSFYLSRLPLSSPDSCIQVQDVLDLSEYFYMLNCWGFTPTLCVLGSFLAPYRLYYSHFTKLLSIYETPFPLISDSQKLALLDFSRLLFFFLETREKKFYKKTLSQLWQFVPITVYRLHNMRVTRMCFFSLFYWIGMGGLLGVMGTIFRECTNSTIFTYVI